MGPNPPGAQSHSLFPAFSPPRAPRRSIGLQQPLPAGTDRFSTFIYKYTCITVKNLLLFPKDAVFGHNYGISQRTLFSRFLLFLGVFYKADLTDIFCLRVELDKTSGLFHRFLS